MPVFDVLHHALNVGVVDEDKLHRVDLERMRLGAEIQTNIMATAIGRGFLRAGSDYKATAPGKCRLMPFVAGQSAAYTLELSDLLMRVIDDTDALVTRPAVTAVVGAFSTYTMAATSGQVSAAVATRLQLTARAHGGRAFGKKLVVCNNPGVEHAVRIVVSRGPVRFRVGSTDGGDELVEDTTLLTGSHSLAFLPAGNFYVQFSNELPILKEVVSCTIEAAGVVTLPTRWPVAALPLIRETQSIDVLYCAAAGYKTSRIERRGTLTSAGRSWSVVDFDSNDGPFLLAPTSDAKLTPGALEGNTTLTASVPLFKANHVGALFRLYHEGQSVDTYLAAENTFTPPIEVTGVNETSYNDRFFTYTTTGTWVGTLRNQRSFDGEDVGFHDFRDKQTSANIDMTGNVAANINDDNEDNAIAYYRIGFPAGKYTSGEARVQITYNGGGGFGIARVVSFVSSTVVNIEILTPFKGAFATKNWTEGAWSDLRGYPYAASIYEGRLLFGGQDKVWGSISDAYDAFSDDVAGESGMIDRAVALGGRNEVRWLLPLSTLIAGCDGRVATARASTLDEIITPQNFSVRNIGPVGVAAISPAEVSEDRALFAEASGQALYELAYSASAGKFQATEFSKLTTELFKSGITGLAVQNRPDQRLHVSVDNNDAMTIVYEPEQKVIAFIQISTSSPTDFIESQCVVPSPNGPDRLWRSVCRVVNGATVRTIEKVALDSEASPQAICKVMDCGVQFGAGNATIGGLTHLEGRTVVVWSDGAPVNQAGTTTTREFVVVGGQITLDSVPLVGGFVGLGYRGRYKSARLAYGTGNTTPVLGSMSIPALGMMLADYVRSGIKIGTEFDNLSHPLSSLPMLAGGTDATEVVTGVGRDEEPFPVNGPIGLDTRICIELNSPKPAAINSLVMRISRP